VVLCLQCFDVFRINSFSSDDPKLRKISHVTIYKGVLLTDCSNKGLAKMSSARKDFLTKFDAVLQGGHSQTLQMVL